MVLGTPLKVNSQNPQQSAFWGKILGQLLLPQHVLCLEGELGTGKTTLARAIVAGWQSMDRVTSPTYTILNIYRHRKDQRQKLYHIDAYRLDSPAAIASSGIDDVFENNSPVIIEWPSMLGDYLPSQHLWIDIAYDPATPDARWITFSSQDAVHQALLQAFAIKIQDHVIGD